MIPHICGIQNHQTHRTESRMVAMSRWKEEGKDNSIVGAEFKICKTKCLKDASQQCEYS